MLISKLSRFIRTPAFGLLIIVIVWISELVIASHWQHRTWRHLMLPKQHHEPRLRSLLSSLQLDSANGCGKAGIWFSPYRQFPEVMPEGNDRGLGDYEYFGHIMASGCKKLRTNYGAFKGSKADLVFSSVSTKGIKAEYEEAKNLGFDFFALDLLKTWYPSGLTYLCLKSEACKLTTDGFIFLDLRLSSNDVEIKRLLSKVTRFGKDGTPAAALRAKTMRSMHLADDEWNESQSMHGIVIDFWNLTQQPGQTTQISSSLGIHPENYQMWLLPAPGISRLVVQLHCQRGAMPVRTISTTAAVNITAFQRSCAPSGITVADAFVQSKGQMIRINTPPHIDEHTGLGSFFGLKITLKEPLTDPQSP